MHDTEERNRQNMEELILLRPAIKYSLIAALFLILIIVACSMMNAIFKQGSEQADPAGSQSTGYVSVAMKDVRKIISEEGEYILLDVRHADEYAEGHIPGAINIDNDFIGDQKIPMLPDKTQEIYIYCRSGNRSKEAAQKLADQGYENIIEIGGISDWTGELEK